MKRLIVYEESCSVCGVCELTCSLRHFKVNNPKKAMIRTKMVLSKDDVRIKVYVCRLCDEKPCIKACPSNAIKFNGSWIEVDEDLCTLCKACMPSCPYQAIFFHKDIGRPLICDLCGGEPQCVVMCPTKALDYV
ncbi:MAG: 4Fe-4S dicluster domain-containing protein [Candidatus Nezhaarchaeota archaeon]|nr:4Fe-4S dicluster domain-containing protein [Candidatus Nezhaarchaeota archaeon]MCX8141522.1 4Fe-4S dicluster domain-containing protein [Candidatus Nezhaarchaeota archaeon]MDW8049789.1 4Fe-4S dicluster domain-containing protein [Nitrososphaerota archaeon]